MASGGERQGSKPLPVKPKGLEMKIITKQEPIYKQVKSGTKEIQIYETEDGMQYTDEKEAIEHEEYLKKEKKLSEISTKILDLDMVLDSFGGYKWYFADTQEHLDIILDKLYQNGYVNNFSNGKKFDRSIFKVGDWITSLYIDGGDYRSNNYIYTLDYMKETFYNFLKNFE